MSYLYFSEAIGQAGIAVAGNMMNYHHNDRDPYTFFKSKKGYIKKDQKIFKVAKKIPEVVNRMMEKDKSPKNEEFYEKYTNKLKRYGNMVKASAQKNAKDNNLMTVNSRGGDVSSKDKNKEYASAWETYHYNNNQRRMKAISRLINHIDKKGYDDESYIKKNKENMERVNKARERLGTNFPTIKNNAEAEQIMRTGKPY